MIDITRRAFLTVPAALIAYGLPIPSLAAPREPYVKEGEGVASIIFHLWDDPRNPGPFGGVYVDEIKPWDGVGYPITLTQGRQVREGFYDFEWSNLLRDVPNGFWGVPGNRERYPNVHAYVREVRFGEHPDVMRRQMAANAGRVSADGRAGSVR